MDWLDLLAVQGTLKSLLQHRSSKASILQHSAFFIAQLSHPYMTTGKTITLTRWTFVGKVIVLLFNMLTSQSNHTGTTALANSMRLSYALWGVPRWVGMVERSDRMWSTREGNGKPLQYSCLENPMNSMKRRSDRILKEELPRSVGAQYASGDQWRINSRKNEGMEPKQKQYPAVDITGDRSNIQCCKEQYCIGTWNVRSIS